MFYSKEGIILSELSIWCHKEAFKGFVPFNDYMDKPCVIYEPHREENCLWGFPPGHAQTSLLSYRDWLDMYEASDT